MCRQVYKIHLVDKCLIVIMAVLLAQSAYSLAAHNSGAAQPNEIDVIVRTSAASIFGYFLSANFIRRDSGESELAGTSLESLSSSEELLSREEDPVPDHDLQRGIGRIQILIAAGIGLFCLTTLILLRDLTGVGIITPSPTAAATITQFRDFVSGCVGFLIGCPTSGGKAGGT